jgi:hypothetical protein
MTGRRKVPTPLWRWLVACLVPRFVWGLLLSHDVPLGSWAPYAVGAMVGCRPYRIVDDAEVTHADRV